MTENSPYVNAGLRSPLTVAVLFELSLAVIAGGVGWAIGVNPFRSPSVAAAPSFTWLVGLGVLAALPTLMLFFVLTTLPVPPLRRLRTWLQQQLKSMLGATSCLGLLAVSLAAGIGEEVLFRGLIQQATERWFGSAAGNVPALVVASLLFGLAHAVTPTYFVLALVMGAYLGWVYQQTGSLYPPIIAHALHDWIALLWLVGKRDSNDPVT